MKLLNNQEIEEARQYISKMPINKPMELKDIYGSDNWEKISKPTTRGKHFKKAHENGYFQNLRGLETNPNGNNHQMYQKDKN